MNENELTGLIHGEIDGRNTADESARLQAYLRRHPELRERFEELKEAVTRLESLGLENPPPDAHRATLDALAELAPRPTRSRRPAARVTDEPRRPARPRAVERNGPMKNKMIWGGVGAVVVVIVAIAVISPFPAEDDLAGAVGVAKQYRSDQITAADVVLEDPEIQGLLQSDFFYKLCTDAEFRKIAIDQLARLDMASGRSPQFTSAASLESMRSFLDLVAGDPDLKMALAEGRMDVVNEALLAEGRAHLVDIANRIYLSQGRKPQLNMTALGNMKLFLDQVVADKDLRMALSSGRLEMVDEILVKDGKADLADAAGRVYLAEARNAMAAGRINLADMRVFLDSVVADPDLKMALAEGRMDMVSAALLAEGRSNLMDIANRIFVTLGRNPELNATALEDMRSFLALAADDPDLRAAMASGRLDMVDAALQAEGRAATYENVAHMIYQVAGRNFQIQNAPSLGNMKQFLDLARTDVQLNEALASGKMNIVHDILLTSGKADLADAANRIYLTLGRRPQLNMTAIGNMRAFVDLAQNDPDLRMALISGRMDMVNEALTTDGKLNLQDAAGRVLVAVNQDVLDSRAFQMADMRAFLDLARTNVQLNEALAAGRMDLVNEALDVEGKAFLQDVANRIYLALGRKPQLNMTSIAEIDRKSVV